MKPNILKEKSFDFAVRIVRLYKYLRYKKEEYILSKQLMRSGTSIGAMVREAEHSESRQDFIHKISIAQKGTNETLYWLELLSATHYLTNTEYESINSDATEIMRLITAILRTAKKS